VEERRSQLCLGLDPAPADPGEVTRWCRGLIDRAGSACVAVKPQLACFERLGARGWEALEEVAGAARDGGLLVIADGKRGDVPHTGVTYAESLFGAAEDSSETPGLRADAATVNPLLGGDSLDPFVDAAADAGAGVFTLVRTSNPGAADLFDLPSPEAPLYERIAALVAERAPRLRGARGLSGMGAVVGATAPERLGRLRELMPDSIFLLPGVGAQGGQAGDLAAALGSHPASIVVPVSRALTDAPDPLAAAEKLRGELWALVPRGG
jgi:orotidine-5'-phosphate decarboxylase